MALMFKLLILCSVIFTATSLRCIACPDNTVCDPLPESADCFPARETCACCPTCAGRFADQCDNWKVRCHPDFVCVNEDGQELEIVPWHNFDFKGVCIRSRCPTSKTIKGK